MNDDEREDTIEGRILVALQDARAPRVRASELAAYLETSRGAVRTGLQSLADTDRVVRHTDGPRALWSLPERADEPDPLATDDTDDTDDIEDTEEPDTEDGPETDTREAPTDDTDAADEEDVGESETEDDDATEGSDGATDEAAEDEPADDDPTETLDAPTEETPDPNAATMPDEPPADPRPDAETAPAGPGRQGVVVTLALLAVVAVLLRRRLRGR